MPLIKKSVARTNSQQAPVVIPWNRQLSKRALEKVERYEEVGRLAHVNLGKIRMD